MKGGDDEWSVRAGQIRRRLEKVRKISCVFQRRYDDENRKECYNKSPGPIKTSIK